MEKRAGGVLHSGPPRCCVERNANARLIAPEHVGLKCVCKYG